MVFRPGILSFRQSVLFMEKVAHKRRSVIHAFSHSSTRLSQCCNATFQLEIRAVTRRGVHMIIRLAIKVRVAGINFGFLFRHGGYRVCVASGIYEDQEPQACGHQITWCFFGSYRDPSH